MGQTFEAGAPRSLAPKISDKISNCIQVLKNAPASVQQKLLMFNSVVVSKANYAPLVEQSTDREANRREYEAIDLILVQYLNELLDLQLTAEKLIKFVTAARCYGGLEIMLPGAYYNHFL